jgi:hypothetical protein
MSVKSKQIVNLLAKIFKLLCIFKSFTYVEVEDMEHYLEALEMNTSLSKTGFYQVFI